MTVNYNYTGEQSLIFKQFKAEKSAFFYAYGGVKDNLPTIVGVRAKLWFKV